MAFIRGINAAVWSDNVDIKLVVWCDISECNLPQSLLFFSHLDLLCSDQDYHWVYLCDPGISDVYNEAIGRNYVEEKIHDVRESSTGEIFRSIHVYYFPPSVYGTPYVLFRYSSKEMQ